ncbi:hypothetical protein PtA15_2A525 [Puccinia triticina]|uniref:Uncharacterized protein n=1 Tax=Puccinia triticina TaxID=208348 RepID=A0ABY7CAL0_9BASI|nr:uncharacterized protein PtA15_2A525 [Puccinia triticina]WAQ82208.1 hypothetical protein PtA15_2A525 [Puccinia triticina]
MSQPRRRRPCTSTHPELLALTKPSGQFKLLARKNKGCLRAIVSTISSVPSLTPSPVSPTPSLPFYPSQAPRPDQAIRSVQAAGPEERTLSTGHHQHKLIYAVLNTQPSLADAVLALLPIPSSLHLPP